MESVVAAGLAVCDVVLHESLLFAAIMFFIGGIDDLLVDLAYLFCRRPAGTIDRLPAADTPPLAIFIGAWDEQAVIGAMLTAALARLDYPDYRILVGCYPNDPATIAAVDAVAARDPRVCLVVGERPGPTTKADCLNTLWRALIRDDARAGRDTRAVVLHDAEDVLHPAELRVVAAHLRANALVQLPVVPLIDPAAPMVTGHYADEFALAHAVALPVRTALGAAMPLAGVGCAIRRDALDRLAHATGDAPFEPASLTEDYELGLRVAALGYASCFVRVRDAKGALVAVRAYFPDTIRAAVVQKARWMTGIALAGWDRTGWGGRWRGVELWMRMRDRRAPLAVLTLAAGYLALVAWAISTLGHLLDGSAPPGVTDLLAALLSINASLLAWRLLVRARATAHEHGWREGLRSVPRAVLGNVIALLAVRRAVWRYVGMLAGHAPRWDKTTHRFPVILPDPA
ncbi:glycosyl transferase family protein [Sphingomonas sp. RHCKR47]|uniref:glycosyl transferase family protein n=1 Tax=Sphingomonas citricola TaxID=2862498 RepID=UPI001CA56911|nr:glycosyl transferase family protein [Sphingomonas citricola]MBW6524136.1 glycosyl transferase family protein [Sphingomonas citricola]